MLINYRLENYKSYGDMQRFSMIPGRYQSKSEHIVKREKFNVLKFSSIYGANASGKSNFVNSLLQLKQYVIDGIVSKRFNSVSFKFSDNEVSTFETEIGIGEEVYVYGLSANIKLGIVFQEYIYRISPEKIIFHLNRKTGEGPGIDEKLCGSSNTYQRYNIYVSDLGTDELFITKVANAKNIGPNEFIEIVRKVHLWFKNTLQVITPKSSPRDIIKQFIECDNDASGDSLVELLKPFDTGITNYSTEIIEEEEFLLKIRNMTNNDELVNQTKNQVLNLNQNAILNLTVGDEYFQIKYNKISKKREVIKFSFEHSNNKIKRFEYYEESDGTKRLIELIYILHMIQKRSYTFIIDELERSLHPNITREFVRKYMQIATMNDSQLILGTHEITIMDLNLFRQDELWGIEKNSKAMSVLSPFSRFRLRNDKVLDKDYLNGRYGAVPHIIKELH